MPTERRLAVSKSDQIFFDAFKTDSNDQAKPLEKYLSSEAKSVPTVSVHVQPKPMKSFHRRKLEDGIKPNTFTVGDDELIEHAESAKVNLPSIIFEPYDLNLDRKKIISICAKIKFDF